MRIIDPQTATLTNVEVLAFLTANPPRRPPNPPPNSRNWAPNPDLRDHNTVVKEIHNYVDRISPHLLNYPRYTHNASPQEQQDAESKQATPYIQPAEPTPLDEALRSLIQELKPYGLTKGEVLVLINLGVGLKNPPTVPNGSVAESVEEKQQQEEVVEEEEEEDYAAQALIESVIEERDERLSDEDVEAIMAIMRNTLGKREG